MFNAKTFIIKNPLHGYITITHCTEPGNTDIFTILFFSLCEK